MTRDSIYRRPVIDKRAPAFENLFCIYGKAVLEENLLVSMIFLIKVIYFRNRVPYPQIERIGLYRKKSAFRSTHVPIAKRVVKPLNIVKIINYLGSYKIIILAQ